MMPFVVVRVDDENSVNSSVRSLSGQIPFSVISQKEYPAFEGEIRVECNYYTVRSQEVGGLLMEKLSSRFPGTSWALAQVLELTYMEPGTIRKAQYTEHGLLPVPGF